MFILLLSIHDTTQDFNETPNISSKHIPSQTIHKFGSDHSRFVCEALLNGERIASI